MNLVFIYGLVDPRSNQIMYVGKANNLKNRLRQHLKPRTDQKMTKVKSWVVSLKKEGLSPAMVVIETCDADSWKSREMFHIEEHRKNNPKLLNMADGGDEPLCDPETRARNAKTLTEFANDNKGVLALLRFFALAIRRHKKAGDLMSVQKFSDISQYIKTSEGVERIRFNELGVRKCLQQM